MDEKQQDALNGHSFLSYISQHVYGERIFYLYYFLFIHSHIILFIQAIYAQ